MVPVLKTSAGMPINDTADWNVTKSETHTGPRDIWRLPRRYSACKHQNERHFSSTDLDLAFLAVVVYCFSFVKYVKCHLQTLGRYGRRLQTTFLCFFVFVFMYSVHPFSQLFNQNIIRDLIHSSGLPHLTVYLLIRPEIIHLSSHPAIHIHRFIHHFILLIFIHPTSHLSPNPPFICLATHPSSRQKKCLTLFRDGVYAMSLWTICQYHKSHS